MLARLLISHKYCASTLEQLVFQHKIALNVIELRLKTSKNSTTHSVVLSCLSNSPSVCGADVSAQDLGNHIFLYERSPNHTPDTVPSALDLALNMLVPQLINACVTL